MNTPSPLVPQGTFPGKPGRSHIRIAVFTILAVHVVLLGALLLQGCKRTNTAANAQPTNTTFSGWQEPPPPSLDFLTNTPTTVVTPPPVPPTVPGADPRPFPGSTAAPATPPSATSVFPTPTEVIPPPPPVVDGVPAPTPAATGAEYVILKGDTFSLIAKRSGVSPQDIANANPRVDPRRLQIGQKIFVPASVPSAGQPGNGAAATNGGKSYTVKSGDTLSGIARKNSTTAQAIRAANNLRTDRIVVGQKLTLPDAPSP